MAPSFGRLDDSGLHPYRTRGARDAPLSVIVTGVAWVAVLPQVAEQGDWRIERCP